MRSIARLTNYNLLAEIILLLVITIFLAAYVWSTFLVSELDVNYRGVLGQVNGIISEINRQSRLDEDSRDLSGLEKRIDELTTHAIPPQLDVLQLDGIVTIVPDIESNVLQLENSISRVSASASAISDRYYQRRRGYISLGSIALGSNLAMLVVLLILGMYLRSALTRYQRSMRHDLESFERMLNYDPVAESPAGGIRWEEEEILAHAMRRFRSEIGQERTLQDLDVNGNLDDLLGRVKPEIDAHMPCDRFAFAFLDANDGIVIAEAAAVDYQNVVLQPGFTERIGRTTLSQVTEKRTPRIINDLEKHYAEVNRSVGTRKVLDEGIRSSITVPLLLENRCVGFMFVSARSKNAYSEADAVRARKIAIAIRQNLYYTFVVQQVVSQTAKGFVKLTEKRDNETSLHIARMAQYGYLIAKYVHAADRSAFPASLIREILWFAPLHDIGKIGIPDDILLKPGRLDSAERSVMESHVTIGEDVMRSMLHGMSGVYRNPGLQTAIDIVVGHHERWDGTGYPRRLAGYEIPVAGRIVALADVFDALTSRRPYKEAFSIEKTLSVIRDGEGSHFDPVMVAALHDGMSEVLQVYEAHKEI